MPQNSDSVSKILASARAASAHADETSALHVTHPTPMPEELKKPAASAAKAAASGAAKSSPTSIGKALESMPSGGETTSPKMHDGGPVLTDGDYNLKAGEHVLTAPQAKMVRKHALMVVGMKRGMSTPATAGEPTKMDAAHKTAKKPSVTLVDRKKGK